MLNKKILECISVLVLTTILSVGAVLGNTNTASETDANPIQAKSDEATVYAGTTEALQNLDVTVEAEEIDSVAAAEETEVAEVSEEEKEWDSKLIASVKKNKTLNIRKKASKDSELVGKMERGDVAEILEVKGDWYKIKSGKVEGYVSSSLVITGSEAYEYANKNFKTVVKSKIDGLRVRKEANKDAKVAKKLSKGDKLEVVKDAVEVDGWVAVTYNKNTCYVSAEYVDVLVDMSYAMTIKEYNKKTNKGKYQKANHVNGSGIDYNDDELKLLANLIYCEAGCDSYECKLACGAVIVNCVKSRFFPNNIHDVIYQKNQYGPASSGSLARALRRDSATSSCYKAAKAALAGEDNTNHALGFQGVACGYSGVVYDSMVFYTLSIFR